MQETRQFILEILKERKQATVDDLVLELRKRRGEITAVTVRHHLTRLQEAELVTAPRLLHRNTPGRPQHVYALTEKALSYFPNNYQNLAANLMAQIRKHVSPEEINVIFEGVADNIASTANMLSELPFEQRLREVIAFLNERGYEARFEAHNSGWLLHTTNCPYHEIAKKDEALCYMDMQLISKLLGVVPRQVSHIAKGDASCTYFIPDHAG